MIRKVYRIKSAGSISSLRMVEEELSEPKESEVTIEVKTIGLNFADIFALTGLYSATPDGSFIPGLEYSGIVIKKGSGIKNFSIGDRIMGVIRFGAYATHINIDYRYIYKIPEQWSFEEGAGFLVQALTAYYALIPLGALKENQNVLIHSAAGGVGIYANRIAKKMKANTIGTVSSDSKITILQKEGYDRVLVREKNFYAQLKRELGTRELNLALDCIGGQIFKDSYKALSPMGRIVVFGSANFTPKGNSVNYIHTGWKYMTRPTIDPLSMISSNKSVLGFNLIWLWDRVDYLSKLFEEILALKLEAPYIGKKFQFEELHQALQFFKSGFSIGKVVVVTI